MQLSDDERRALVLLAALLVLASGARWLERPRPLLDDVPALDLEALESASRAARPAARVPASGAGPRVAQNRTDAAARNGRSAGNAAAQTGDAAWPADASAASRTDPNTASAAELTALPGVGPALADRIVAERSRAPFTSVADLTRVRGIGPALAARLAPLVTLPEAGYAEAAPKTGNTEAAPKTGHTEAAPTGNTEAAPPEIPRANGAPAAAARPDLNTATAAELQRLPGVGPVLAARLVARRDSLGGFAGWPDVDAVPGVGPAMLARLKAAADLRPRG